MRSDSLSILKSSPSEKLLMWQEACRKSLKKAKAMPIDRRTETLEESLRCVIFNDHYV